MIRLMAAATMFAVYLVMGYSILNLSDRIEYPEVFEWFIIGIALVGGTVFYKIIGDKNV